ncbi:AI-2E family transporter [Isoptericola hypogeus]|uniref:AI-2E family transporter n=1 Tax=Isoptericola hypogeus TaxID=300179 RepID=A0ABN2JIQ2_9MICO
MDPAPTPSPPATIAGWERAGRRAWAFVGIVLASLAVYVGLSLLSGIVVPLIVAVVVGALFAPLVDRLARRMPRAVGAGIVLLALLALAAVVIGLAIDGVVDQADEIGEQLARGFDEAIGWFQGLGVGGLDAGRATEGTQELGTSLIGGLAAGIGSVFSSTAAFVVGLFVGVFLLYFVLADWHELSAWTARHLGVPRTVGTDLVEDTTWALRQYFLALSITSLVVSALVGITAAVLGLPLALTIAVVTFVTSYVPFLGAILSGAFAVLIALGSGGLTDAVVMLAVVLIAQNAVQTLLQTKLTQGRLQMHPIVILGSTIAGAAAFGLLGAALSTPVVAIVVKAVERLRGAPDANPGTEPDGAGHDPAPAGA